MKINITASNFALLLLMIILVSSCISIKISVKKPPLDYKYFSGREITRIATYIDDSLHANGCDSSLILIKGCSGCISGSPAEVYIIHVRNNEAKIIIINNYYIYSYDSSYFGIDYKFLFEKDTLDKMKGIIWYVDHGRYNQLIRIVDITKETIVETQRSLSYYSERYKKIYYLESEILNKYLHNYKSPTILKNNLIFNKLKEEG